MSAFAARKAHAAVQSTSSSPKETSSSQNHIERNSQQVTSDVPSRNSNRGKSSPVKNDLPSISPGFIVEGNGRGEEPENNIMRCVLYSYWVMLLILQILIQTSSDSREQSPEVISNRPSMVLSTFKPSDDNTKVLKSRILVLKLAPGEVSDVISVNYKI